MLKSSSRETGAQCIQRRAKDAEKSVVEDRAVAIRGDHAHAKTVMSTLVSQAVMTGAGGHQTEGHQTENTSPREKGEAARVTGAIKNAHVQQALKKFVNAVAAAAVAEAVAEAEVNSAAAEVKKRWRRSCS